MTRGVEIPHRETIQVVLMLRTGLGWTVGVGGLLAGRIERDHMGFANERDARVAALALSDRLDLFVVRSEAPGA